jgi:hypothetical protein
MVVIGLKNASCFFYREDFSVRKIVIITIMLVSLFIMLGCGEVSNQRCYKEEKTINTKVISHTLDSQANEITILVDDTGQQYTRSKHLGEMGGTMPLLVKTKVCKPA